MSWDLRYDTAKEVRLRTTPEGNPHVWEEKRFRGKDHRPIIYYGIGNAPEGPLVAPGTYTVKLELDGTTQSAKVEVRKDPNSAATSADVEKSSKFTLALYRDINSSVEMINQIEWSRKQLEDLKKILTAEKAEKSLFDTRDELEKKALAVEDRLVQRTLADDDQKSFRGPLQLYMQLVWLDAEAGSGRADVSGGADFAPTRAEEEVHSLLRQRLFATLYEKTIPAFNDTMREKGLLQLIPVKEVQDEVPELKETPEDDDVNLSP